MAGKTFLTFAAIAQPAILHDLARGPYTAQVVILQLWKCLRLTDYGEMGYAIRHWMKRTWLQNEANLFGGYKGPHVNVWQQYTLLFHSLCMFRVFERFNIMMMRWANELTMMRWVNEFTQFWAIKYSINACNCNNGANIQKQTVSDIDKFNRMCHKLYSSFMLVMTLSINIFVRWLKINSQTHTNLLHNLLLKYSIQAFSVPIHQIV